MSAAVQDQPQDWNTFYQIVPADDVPWELGGPSYELSRIVQEGIVVPPARVLDVGSGLGSQSIFLAKNGFEVIGIDIAETAVLKARKLAEFSQANATFRVADITALPYSSESFDMLYDRGCFHHLKSRDQELYRHEISRCLTDGGTFMLVVFAQAMTAHDVEQFFMPTFELLEEEVFTITEKNSGNNVTLRSLLFEKQASNTAELN